MSLPFRARFARPQYHGCDPKDYAPWKKESCTRQSAFIVSVSLTEKLAKASMSCEQNLALPHDRRQRARDSRTTELMLKQKNGCPALASNLAASIYVSSEIDFLLHIQQFNVQTQCPNMSSLVDYPDTASEKGSLGDCRICLVDLVEATPQLPCSHMFNQEYVERWARVGPGTCPICRQPLPIPPSDPDHEPGKRGHRSTENALAPLVRAAFRHLPTLPPGEQYDQLTRDLSTLTDLVAYPSGGRGRRSI